jgi:hypothetical protein
MAKSSKSELVFGHAFLIVEGMYKGIHKYMTGHDIQSKHMFYILFWATLAPLFIFNLEGARMVGIVLIVLSPFWLIPALVASIWRLWKDYINLLFLADEKQEAALYEIKVPRDIQKSPAAMELFFNGLLLSQGEGTAFDVYWHGKVRPWFSLEITGINGEVRLYLWCWKRYKEHVEAQLYGQFPSVELHEVEDYAANINYDPEKHFAWGHRYKLDKEEAYPIKTYVDYGLHENPDKWETKIDPMVNILEKFALQGPGEQMWLQILFQKSDRETATEAEEEIKKIYADNTQEYPSMSDPSVSVAGFPMLKAADTDKVKAIDRARTKPSFDCVMRGVYIADLDKMNTSRIQSMGKMFNYYDGYNALKPFDGKAPGGDWPWQDYTMPDPAKVLKKFIAAYRLRSGFHVPYRRPSITLTSEELATIFHFPSAESAVPGLQKNQAKTGSPPSNLPIG